MMAVPVKVHDPLYNFETHFPERLSRLHLTPEFQHYHPAQRRSKKTRAARQGVRYKTQPITFDEIQEVDEENIKEEDKDKSKVDGLKNQFSAFSRSMDGLVPKGKVKKDRDTIPEVVVGETTEQDSPERPNSQPSAQTEPEVRLQSAGEPDQENKENNGPLEKAGGQSHSSQGLPPSGPHAVNQRRPRMTAKAKRRLQSADGTVGGDKET